MSPQRERVLQYSSVVGGLILWEIVGRSGVSFMIPPITSVLARSTDVWLSDAFLSALRDSAVSLTYGYVAAVVVGVVAGLLMGIYKHVEWALDPYVNLFMTSPKAALVPIFAMLFGTGRTVIVVTVFMFSVFIIIVNTFTGVRAVSGTLREMGRSFGATRLDMFLRVILPAASPLILAGLRLGAGRAIKGVIIGEQLIAVVGLGALVNRYGGGFQVEQLYAMVLFIGLAGLLAMTIIKRVENRTLSWTRTDEL